MNKDLFKEYQSLQSKALKLKMLEQGLWSYSPPLGYKFVKRNKRDAIVRNPRSDLIVDEETAPIIKRLFELYVKRAYTQRQISQILAKEFPHHPISPGSLHNILRNPFYGGFMQIDKTTKRYIHHYPRIISQETYDKAVQINTTSPLRRKLKGMKPYVLRGLFTCYDCGCALTPEKHKGHVYYHCTQAKGKHNAPWINEKDLKVILKDFIQNQFPNQPDWDLSIAQESQIICGKYFQRIYFHSNKTLSGQEYAIEKIQEISTDNSISYQIRVLCKNPISIDLLYEKLQGFSISLLDIQNELMNLQIDGKITQDEQGLWRS